MKKFYVQNPHVPNHFFRKENAVLFAIILLRQFNQVINFTKFSKKIIHVAISRKFLISLKNLHTYYLFFKIINSISRKKFFINLEIYFLSGSGCHLEGDPVFHSPGSRWHPYIPPHGFSRCATCTCLVLIFFFIYFFGINFNVFIWRKKNGQIIFTG